jgi:hypothetical protein
MRHISRYVLTQQEFIFGLKSFVRAGTSTLFEVTATHNERPPPFPYPHFVSVSKAAPVVCISISIFLKFIVCSRLTSKALL